MVSMELKGRCEVMMEIRIQPAWPGRLRFIAAGESSDGHDDLAQGPIAFHQAVGAAQFIEVEGVRA